MKTEIIEGGRYTDARGVLRFCNDFDMSAVKRFYTIANSAEQPLRGWIGHKKETKWFFPAKGKTVICVEPFNADEQRDIKTEEFVLVAENPRVVKVPPGNWFKIVQDGNAEVIVFSNSNVGEFEGDDFRKAL